MPLPLNSVVLAQLNTILQNDSSSQNPITQEIYHDQIIPIFSQIRANIEDGAFLGHSEWALAWFSAIGLAPSSPFKREITQQFFTLRGFNINTVNLLGQTTLDIALTFQKSFGTVAGKKLSIEEKKVIMDKMMTFAGHLRAQGAKTRSELDSETAAARANNPVAATTPADTRLNQVVNYNQNTSEVDESVAASVKKLAIEYPGYKTEAEVGSFKEEIIRAARSIYYLAGNDEHPAVKQIQGFLDDGWMENKPYDLKYQIDISVQQVLWIVWQALKDPEYLKDLFKNIEEEALKKNISKEEIKQIKKKKLAEENTLRLRSLFKSIIEAQSENICGHGRFNKLISVLEHLHPQVELFAVTFLREFVVEKIKHLFKQKIEALPPKDHMQAMAFYSKSGDGDPEVISKVRTAIEQAKSGAIEELRAEVSAQYSTHTATAAHTILNRVSKEKESNDVSDDTLPQGLEVDPAAVFLNIAEFHQLQQWILLNQYLRYLV